MSKQQQMFAQKCNIFEILIFYSENENKKS